MPELPWRPMRILLDESVPGRLGRYWWGTRRIRFNGWAGPESRTGNYWRLQQPTSMSWSRLTKVSNTSRISPRCQLPCSSCWQEAIAWKTLFLLCRQFSQHSPIFSRAHYEKLLADAAFHRTASSLGELDRYEGLGPSLRWDDGFFLQVSDPLDTRLAVPP